MSQPKWQSLQQSADLKRKAVDHAKAIELYTQALASKSVPWEAYVELTMSRAYCQRMLGRFADVDASLTALAEKARQQDDAAAVVRAYAELIFTFRKTGELKRGLEVAQEALDIANRTGQPELKAEALLALGEIQGMMGKHQEGNACADQAFALIEPHDSLKLIKYHFIHDSKLGIAAKYQELVASNKQAVELARSIGDRDWEGMLLNQLGIYTYDLAANRTLLEQALSAFKAAGDLPYQALVTYNMSFGNSEVGLYHRVIEAIQPLIELNRSMGSDSQNISVLLLLGIASFLVGETQAAYKYFTEGIELAEKTGETDWEFAHLAWMSISHALLQESKTAFDYLQKMTVLLREPSEYEPVMLSSIRAIAHAAAGDFTAAYKEAEQALSLLDGLSEEVKLAGGTDVNGYLCYRALVSAGDGSRVDETTLQKAWHALEIGIQTLLTPIRNLSDAGLKRGYLHRNFFRRLLVLEWLRLADSLDVSADKIALFINLVQKPGRLDEVFTRLLRVGLRLNTERDPAMLPDEIVEEVNELTGAERIALVVLDDQAKRILSKTLLPRPPFPSLTLQVEAAPDPHAFLEEIQPWLQEAIETRQGFIRQLNPDAKLTQQLSVLVTPLISQGKLVGVIYCDIRGCFGRFDPEDLNLLTVLANQSAVALENANWSATLEQKVNDRTAELKQSNEWLEQRTAELTIINSVQEGLASKLDMQEIYDLVCDKIRQVFEADVVGLVLYDEENNVAIIPHMFDHGQRYYPAPQPVNQKIFKRWMTRQPLLIETQEEVEQFMAEYDLRNIGGPTPDNSHLYVPFMHGEKLMGVMSIAKLAPHSFDESDVRLLQTLVNSMSVALDNARLFEETQRLFKAEQARVAELAILNKVGDALSRQLDVDAIVKIVGDQVRDTFKAEVTTIHFYDPKSKLITTPYYYDKGYVLDLGPLTLGEGMVSIVIQKREPLVLLTVEEETKAGGILVPDAAGGGGDTKSYMGVPIIVGDNVIGVVSIQSYQEYAFQQSHVSLLSTLASSMGVAIANARQFQAEQERVAELEIINSIQQGLAKELDFQAIVDLVGDKLREVLHVADIGINWFDEKTNLIHYMYAYEHGERLRIDPMPPTPGGPFERLVKTRKPQVFNTPAESLAVTTVIPGTDTAKSSIHIPVISSDRVLGGIVLDNFEREYAFGESELRLLTTIAASLGTALENARLFDETQRLFKAEQDRVTELQIINSIQQGLAKELDFQAIVDLVGDKLREIFQTPDLGIYWHDEKTGLTHPMYLYEHDQRLVMAPYQPVPGGPSTRMGQTHQPLVWNTVEEGDAIILPTPGTDSSKSGVMIPIISSDRVRGSIHLENYDREYAYGEAEIRLLTTIAASLGSALENARLFDETQRLLKETEQRNAELAIINSVQAALAAELDIQGIYDAVGDKIKEIFNRSSVGIRIYDPRTSTLHFPYTYENGKRIVLESLHVSEENRGKGFSGYVMSTRETLVINENMEQAVENYGSSVIPGTLLSKSDVYVPLVVGDQAYGLVVLADFEREHAFSDSDVRLLQTLVNSMSVALENARLFDETQRLVKSEQARIAELEIINSIQQGLAAELDFQAIIDLVGDKLREVFASTDMMISWYDIDADLAYHLYLYERGKRLSAEPTRLSTPGSLFESFSKNRKPNIWNNKRERGDAPTLPGTTTSTSGIAIPIISSDKIIGAIQLFDIDRENAFGEAEQRLLTTIAASLGSALENAHLFDETQRLLKETEQRNAELDILNSVSDALSKNLNVDAIIKIVGDKVRDTFRSEVTTIHFYDPKSNLVSTPYAFDRGYVHPVAFPYGEGLTSIVIQTREPLVLLTAGEGLELSSRVIPDAAGGEGDTQSYLGVPIIVGDTVIGVVSVQNYQENAYQQSHISLLSTLASSMGVAIANARQFQAEQERVAELEIINSIQKGLAAELDFQAIVDLVGDKLREVFKTGDLGITWWDEKANLVHYLYTYEHGKRFFTPPAPPKSGGIYEREMKNRQPFVMNATEMAKIELVAGTDRSLSAVNVPIISGDRFLGDIAVENFERDNAFGESEIRLLTTIAASLGTALENARLFNETQRLLKETEQRAAELAMLNSVGDAMSRQLDIKTITHLVGDKVREIFASDAVLIYLYDPKTNILHPPYVYDKGYIDTEGSDKNDSDALTDPIHRSIIIDRKSLLFGTVQELLDLGAKTWPDAEGGEGATNSFLGVPIIVGEQVRGLVSVQSYLKNAFDDADLRLLSTMASSMGVAIENARLFEETQRLLDETQQRNSELAIINSVQAALAAELNIQGIYDAVGDKIREIFQSENLEIRIWDLKTNLEYMPYLFENGQRVELEPHVRPATGFGAYVARTRETLVINENVSAEAEKYGSFIHPGTLAPKSVIFVPLIVGDQARGLVDLSDFKHENAFNDSDVRLLQTLVNSMSVALENARLFNETQRLLAETEQRNSELAIINSVQAALAAELNIQGIYDAVGDKIREIFHSDNLEIRIFDLKTNLILVPYIYENGERIEIQPRPFEDGGIGTHLLKTRETLLINENMLQELESIGSYIVPGTQAAKSAVYVPLIVGDQVRGLVGLSDLEREHAFSESDVRLLQTLVNSMSVALENARLFNETQRLLAETEQRNSELAIINSVQAALAAELNIQGIYEAVGDKIREIFDSDNLEIRIFNPVTNQEQFPYVYEKGERVDIKPLPRAEKGFSAHIARTRETIVINENVTQEAENYGSRLMPGTEAPRSVVYVPLIVGDQVRGLVGLSDFEHEHAFGDSDVRLLQTLVNSMSVALENARLFNETQRLLEETSQRANELSIINHVSQAMSRQLQVESIVHTVGDQVRDTLHSEVVNIYLYDAGTQMIALPYSWDRQYVVSDPFPYGSGLTSHVIDSKQPLILGSFEDIVEAGALLNPNEPGDELMPQSYLGVPIIVGDKAIGAIDVQSYTLCVYDDSHIRLLSTLASSMGVALENARLFEETQRLLKETEQHNAELAVINRVQQALASKLDLQDMIDLFGDEIMRLFPPQQGKEHNYSVFIALYDPQTNIIKFPYLVDGEGVRFNETPTELGAGLTSQVIRTSQPLLLNTLDEQTALGAIAFSDDRVDMGSQSWIGVPILKGDQVIGVFSVQDQRPNLFTKSDVRLLSTLASSLGVALENARLFEETRRLLAETEQRNRELGIISRIGQALAGQLDPQGIFDLVGAELQQVFDAQMVGIIAYDRQENLAYWRYFVEKGERQSVPPHQPVGFSGHILRTRAPILISHDIDEIAKEYGSTVLAGELPKSYLGVPLVAGGEVTGVITLQNMDRENAFSENDLRLLSTLALNMGVALENARLYQETQHHAVEMAALAEIGSDIASTHEMEPVLVRMATKTRELMQVRDIAMYLLQPDGRTLKPIVSQGKYAAETMAQSITIDSGMTGSVAQSGVAEIINEPEHDPRAIHIDGTADEGEEPECIMIAPLISRGRVIGAMSVYRDREQGLFTQLELDFLVSLARQAAIAIESARLYTETERRATEMAALAEVSREISATLELQVVLDRIAEQARDLLSASDSAVYLLQPDGISIKAIAAQGTIAAEVLADEGAQLGSGIIGSIVASGEAEWVNDTIKDQRVEQIPGTEEIVEGEKLMVAPLLIQDRAIGALAVWRQPADPPFNQSELSFAISLAQQTVVAIENARLFESAQESQRRMADIIDFLPDATFVVNSEGKVIAWNHAIEEMTGVKAADILGKGDYEYSLPFYGERRPILIDTVLQPDEKIEKKYNHIQRSEDVLVGEAVTMLKGKQTYLNATASALKNSRGEVVGAIESIRDITEQKLGEQELHQAKVEAEAANQAKSAFLAMMSHEIRTPMNAIIGMSGLLMDTQLNPDQREFSETIRSSGDSLLTIINDILDFSKIEAGKMTLEEVPFDLRECVEASLDLMRVRASEKNLELAYQIEPGVPGAIIGDVTRLRQVLINLLGNSVKFTEQGEVVLTVGLGEEKDSLHFSVCDTGIGIPPDRIGMLFKAFTQADASTSRRYGGTGLGLALSTRIVELMGGKMWVESEGVPGKGSIFHFIILAKPALDWKGRPHMEGEHPQLLGKRVLLVDDNATNRRILQLQTQAWGMLPSECASALEALDILRQGERFDLAILDLHMPDMTGVDLADEIRKLEDSKPGTTHMPLVLSTSLGGREEGRESEQFAAILLKPIRQSALFDMLMTLFTRKPGTVDKPTADKTSLDPEMASRHPLRILLAEDNVVNQKLALRLLSQMGYRADVAANGLEVLQAVKRQPYDVIFMDVQMPEMDGLEATRRLCADIPAGKRPRIIAMTANAMQGDREMCLEAGMDDYLSKPIRVEELVAALNTARPLSVG